MPYDAPLSIRSFPRAILHIDGDAFFASCEQARDPRLKGKPVITGKERGIAASMSYEAKARGVTRGMRLFEIKKLIPEAVILPSDYETYSLLSHRFYTIVRRYTPDVEEYGIDECFADITGLRRSFRTSYRGIADAIRKELENDLGFSFSIGLAPTKVLAKVGSKWKKPDGLTAIPGREIQNFLKNLPAEKIWGIGPQTSALLLKLGIFTALQFAKKPEEWVKRYFTKPHHEIWHELNGRSVLPVNTESQAKHYSIQKVKTFTPPSSDPRFIFAQLSKNIENACIRARRYKVAPRRCAFFLRTQEFRDYGIEVRLSHPTAFAHEIIRAAENVFPEVFRNEVLYRSTGVVLYNMDSDEITQPDLFGSSISIEKYTRLYKSVDHIKTRYGKHTLYLGSSYLAHRFSQHEGERGDVPERKQHLLKGESKRRRLSIPMLMGFENI